jgi:hypothetical protein
MQEISKIDDKGLVNFLITRIPEFKDKSSQIKEESAYLHYGVFALFLLDVIEEGINNELIDRAFDLLNDLINLDDPNINTGIATVYWRLFVRQLLYFQGGVFSELCQVWFTGFSDGV